MVRFSDLSPSVINDGDESVKIVVIEHPAITDGVPREIEALAAEVKGIEDKALNVVRVELHRDGAEPVTLTLDVKTFDDYSTDTTMAEAIMNGVPMVERRRGSKTAGSSSEKAKINYATLEHCGRVHRGKLTEAEKELVRTNLEAVNANLRKLGERQIDPKNPEHAAKYSL